MGNRLEYIPALDGLRAVAVLLVMAFHARVPAFHAGYVGVDVFFVLSGFLISTILLGQLASSGTVRLLEFYIRRLFRLAPALLAMLLAYVTLAPLAWPDGAHNRDALLAALYISDYSKAFWDAPNYISHTWSLSVEEHYYLLWPLALMALHRRYTGARLLIVLAAIFVVTTAWRAAWVVHDASWAEIYYRFDTRLSGMMLGSLLAACMLHQPCRAKLYRWRAYLYLLPIAALFLANKAWRDGWMLQYGLTLIEAGAAAVILAVMFRERWITDLLSSPLLIWIGKLSYAMYLWHYPIMRWLREDSSWLMTLAVGSIISMALAWLSAKTVERWGYAVRDHLIACLRRRSKGQEPAPAQSTE